MLAVTTMPKQAPLRLIKRCRLYLKRGDWKESVPITRGIYVLYRQGTPSGTKKKVFEVVYIGVGGIAKSAKSGVRHRIRNHEETKPEWTHYSFFEVHDNVSREEILELEALFLQIFRHDPQIRLANLQRGSRIFKSLSTKSAWRNID